MTAKTNFSKNDLLNILSNYDLGEYVDSKPFTQGSVQTNLLIQMTRGKYAFKYYENRTTDSVLFEINLLQFLKSHSYPSPAPIKNKNGNFVGTHRGKPYCIFNYIDGKHVDNPNSIQKRELIRHIAKLL